MRWLRQLLRRDEVNPLEDPLNLDGILAEGLHDRASARKAIDQLNRERKAILKSQRTLEKRSRAMGPGAVKTIIRSGRVAELQSQQLSQAMQQANHPGSGLNTSSQIAALEERLAAIDRTRSQLYAYLDRLG
jgi:hypothetical protein